MNSNRQGTRFVRLTAKPLAVLHALPTAKRLLETLVAAFGILLLCGCEDNEAPPPAPATQSPTSAEPATPTPQPPASSSPSSPTMMPSKGTTAWGPVLEDSPPAASPSPPVTPPAATTPPPPAPTKRKAEVGVGKKGRGYGKGVIVTPIASLFATRERLVFEVQIPEAMKLFKAMEDHAPKTHEEFMEKIIKANNIHLPQLPEGDRYMYDPKTEQLMVEKPAPE